MKILPIGTRIKLKTPGTHPREGVIKNIHREHTESPYYTIRWDGYSSDVGIWATNVTTARPQATTTHEVW